MCKKIFQYFPSLTETQRDQFELLQKLYPLWNERINVISRKDIDNLEVNHILHSLSIAKFIDFKDGSRILDLGTGGGLPGLPLAIVFPGVHFHLIDRIRKKIQVAKSIAEELGMHNVSFQHGDSGECKEKFDFVVSRAVMPQDRLVKLVRNNIDDKQLNALPNGIIALKGGDLNQEIQLLKNKTEVFDIKKFFNEPFFETKKIVYTIV